MSPPHDGGSARGLRRGLGAATQVPDHVDDHRQLRDPGRAAVNLQVPCKLTLCCQLARHLQFVQQEVCAARGCFSRPRATTRDVLEMVNSALKTAARSRAKCASPEVCRSVVVVTEPAVFHCEIFFTCLCVWYVLHLMCHAAKSDA